MNFRVLFLTGLAILLTSASVFAFTPSESNDVVRVALGRAFKQSFEDNFFDSDTWEVASDGQMTWTGFLGGDETNGWSLVGKRMAFLEYLNMMATNDLSHLDFADRTIVRIALDRCEFLSFTNSVAAMEKLALNPNGIFREQAITISIKYSPISNTTTTFVETILTNVTGYSRLERARAACGYADRILSEQSGLLNGYPAITSAIGMLYRHRCQDGSLTLITDQLFSEKISGYSMSSNRLDFALRVLGNSSCTRMDRRDFTAITNQLLSSGQPLQQLTIEGEGE